MRCAVSGWAGLACLWFGLAGAVLLYAAVVLSLLRWSSLRCRFLFVVCLFVFCFVVPLL